MGKPSIASLIIARKWLVLVAASMGLYLVLAADRGLAQDDQGVKPGVPNGTYAFRDSGYVPAGPSESLVPLAAAGTYHFLCRRDHERRTDGLNQRSDQSDHDPRNLDDQSRW